MDSMLCGQLPIVAPHTGAEPLTVCIPEVIEGPLNDVLWPGFGLWSRRVEESGLCLAHLSGQFTLLRQFLP